MPTWLYHITPIENLSAILQSGQLLAKNQLQAQATAHTSIAYEHIQDRRSRITVPCGPGGVLHDYVPFYFAPRSPMLYAIHRGSVSSYSQGQASILHLSVTFEDISRASLNYVFTDGHAVMGYTSFYDHEAYLDEAIDEEVMQATYWNDTDEDGDRKRRRQAEFLVHQALPWSLIRGIGVISGSVQTQVLQILTQHGQTTPVVVRPRWYY
jgi:hypothetical protein